MNYTPCESASRESPCGLWVYSTGKAGDETKMADLFRRRPQINVWGTVRGGGEVHADCKLRCTRATEGGALAIQHKKNSRGTEGGGKKSMRWGKFCCSCCITAGEFTSSSPRSVFRPRLSLQGSKLQKKTKKKQKQLKAFFSALFHVAKRGRLSQHGLTAALLYLPQSMPTICFDISLSAGGKAHHWEVE